MTYCIFLKKNKFLKQHLSYLENITDFKQLNYEFDVKKFSDRNEIVNQFKKMYEKNLDDVFNTIWDNNGLKKNLFETNVTKADTKLDFIDLVKDTKSEFYNLIKVE